MLKEPLSIRTTSMMFLIALSYLLFAASMMTWMVFLWRGSLPLNAINLDDEVTKLGFDSALSMAFFVQHSGMIRRPFRRFLVKFGIGAEYHGAIYSIASSVVLLLAVVPWQKSTYMVAAPKGIVIRSLMRTMFVLAILGMFWAMYALKAFDVCGVDPILKKIGMKDPQPPMPLRLSGPYYYVRHPNYFCCLVLIWACPDLSLDRLLHNVMWSTWVVVGTFLEERDLVVDFGGPYRDYMNKVPMLLPWRVGTFVWTKPKRNAVEQKED